MDFISAHLSSINEPLNLNFEKILPRHLSTDDILKSLDIYLPRFLLFRHLGVFSAFSGLRAISSEVLKVNRIDFRKSEKILPREWSKGVIFKFLVIYLEN